MKRMSIICSEHPQTQKLFEESKAATYRALKKNSSQVKIGSTGRKNCLVIGTNNASISSVAAPVLINGPGAWLMESENMHRIINIKYCPS
jgi:hypothetical protein